jgi:low affinity Fe/Cu permease
MPSKKIGQPRPLQATRRASCEDFDRLHERLEETIAAVERLQQDYGIQVQCNSELRAAIDRLVQHVQALTAALRKPREIE